MTNDARARLAITAEDLTRRAWDSAANTARAGAKKISGDIKGLLGSAVAGLSVAAISKLVKESLDYGDAIGRAAVKSGLTTEAISELGFAAAGSSIEISELSKALGTMQVNISKAEQGNKALQDSFYELGVIFDRFQKLRADKQFEVLAEAINRVHDETDRARLANEIFGGSGANLLPLFSQGAEGIRKAREEAVRLGLSLGPEQQQKLQDAGDAMGKLGKAASGLATELTIKLAPALTILFEAATEFMSDSIDVPKRIAEINKELAELQSVTAPSEGKGVFSLFLEGQLEVVGARKEVQELKAELLDLQSQLKEGNKDDTDGVLKEMVEIKGPGPLNLRLRTGPDEDVRRAIDEQAKLRDLALEGEVERNRVLDEITGRGMQGDRREQSLEREREYFDELTRTVTEGAEQTSEASEASLDQYFARIEEKSRAKNDFLRGATEEFGRTVQSSLSDVFFNAGQGADKFADSVLNAFKRIIADAAANKVVGLLGDLFGGKKDPGVGGGLGSGLVQGSGGGLLGSVLGTIFGGARAQGGDADAGKAYLIGERGPELFLPRQSGTVVPNSALGRMATAGGGNVTIQQTINMTGSEMSPARMAAFGKSISDQTVARIKDEQKRGKLRL